MQRSGEFITKEAANTTLAFALVDQASKPTELANTAWASALEDQADAPLFGRIGKSVSQI